MRLTRPAIIQSVWFNLLKLVFYAYKTPNLPRRKVDPKIVETINGGKLLVSTVFR
jgi:hypothetical protein